VPPLGRAGAGAEKQRPMNLLSQERLELLLSWRHSGSSVHNEVRLAAGDNNW